jgi:NADH:ubiquinone oxidoreductase subunit 5 (subunit L)/multisubunit Na+/H+ antiporter MnhA subunit
MITAFVLKIVLVAIALIVVVVLVRSFFGGPARAKARDERIRLPRFVAVIAVILVVFALLAALLGFGSGNMRDPMPFRIASVVLLVAGLLVLLAYRNRYVLPGTEAIAFRTVLGAERSIRYRDIVSHRTTERRGRRMLVVRSSAGDTLRVDPSAPGMAPLVAAVAARA